MFNKVYQFALGFCALLFLALAPAYADNPPDWMDGTFEGFNRQTNQTIIIRMNHSGRPIVTNQDRGRSLVRTKAEYRRGNLIIDGTEYRVEKINNGFRTTQIDDRQNRVDFRRIGDYNDNWQNGRDIGRNGSGDYLPDWMSGAFEGENYKIHQKYTLLMTRSGRMTATSQRRNRDAVRSTADYRRGYLILDGREYRIEKSERGFRATDVNDRESLIDFFRTGDAGEDSLNGRDLVELAPEWMNGTFEGVNHETNQTFNLRMNRSGRPIVTIRGNGRSESRSTAEYRRGNLIIDGTEYRVEKINNGFRTTQIDDRQNRVDFQRIGDYNDNGQDGRDIGRDTAGDNAPDWMNGVFEGFNRKYNQTIVFRMNRDGSMSVTNQENGRTVQRNKADYRRGNLIIAGKEYRVEKTTNGFRTTQVDDSANRVDFKRTGNSNE